MKNPYIIQETIENDFVLPIHWKINSKSSNVKVKTEILYEMGNFDTTFKEDLLNSIRKAKETIMISSFIMSDEEIINEIIDAAKREVRIYLLFSTDVQLEKEFRDDPSIRDKKTLDFHKNFLRNINKIAIARSSGFLHAKFMIIDYGTPKQKGFISTANFTKEALTRNEEIGVKLFGKDIEDLFAIFQNGFWEESNQQLVENMWVPAEQKKLSELKPTNRILYTMKNRTLLKKHLLKIIEMTKGSLVVSSYIFKTDNSITKKIIEACRNRDVKILLRPRDTNWDAINEFTKAGAKIYAYDFIHAKFLLAPEDKRGVIMTANFDNKGLETGYEVGLNLNEIECSELEKISKKWINNAQYSLEKEISIKESDLGLIKIREGNELVQYSIIQIKENNEEIKINDLRDLISIKTESIESKQKYDYEIPKLIENRMIINLPTLPEKATKIKENPFKYPLFVYKNKQYIVLNKEKQIDEIIQEYGNKLKSVSLVIK